MSKKKSDQPCSMVRDFMSGHSGFAVANSVHLNSLQMASTAIVQGQDNRTGSLLAVGVVGVEVVYVGQSQEVEEAGGPVDKLVAAVDDSQQEVEADSVVLRVNLSVIVIVEEGVGEQEQWVSDTIERLCADVQVEVAAEAAEAQNHMNWHLGILHCPAGWDYRAAIQLVEPVGMVYAEMADAQSLAVEEVVWIPHSGQKTMYYSEAKKYNHEAVKEMYDYILGIPAGVRSESAVGLMLVWVVECIAAGVQIQEDTAEGGQWVMDVGDIVGIGMMTAVGQGTGWEDILVDEMVA